MVMTPQPIFDCYFDIMRKLNMGEDKDSTQEDHQGLSAGTKTSSTYNKAPRVIYLSPKGKTFDQQMAIELSKEKALILLCGHYEGIDQRVIDEIVTDEVSIGDYVLTGGEIPAMVMIDAIARLIPGVLSHDQSFEDESFYSGLLEYPQYTRPREFRGLKVPDVLTSGDHKRIEEWRRNQSLEITFKRRPDLLKNVELSKKDIAFLSGIKENK